MTYELAHFGEFLQCEDTIAIDVSLLECRVDDVHEFHCVYSAVLPGNAPEHIGWKGRLVRRKKQVFILVPNVEYQHLVVLEFRDRDLPIPIRVEEIEQRFGLARLGPPPLRQCAA